MGHAEMDTRIEELMWLDIDEAISPGDRESLHAHMETHPDAREHLEALRRMAALFDQAGEVDPPVELHARILAALERAKPPTAARAGVLDRLGEFLAPRLVWRYAAVAVAGVLIGAAGYHLVREEAGKRDGVDVSHLYGTVTLNGADRRGPALRIDVPGVRGTVSVGREGSRVSSYLDVTSEAGIEIVIEYGGPPLGYTGGEASGHPSSRVSIEDGEVRVRHQGKGEYRFLFGPGADPSSPMTVRLLSEGKVLYEGRLEPPRAEAR